MPDMICPLYEIPDYQDTIDSLFNAGIRLVHAKPWDRSRLHDFIEAKFSNGWADEVLRAFNNTPISVILAVDGRNIVGFAAYEATARGYFGPTGVDEAFRGRGIGKALFFRALEALKSLGYVYGIIGSPGPVEFYNKVTKCIVLPQDWPTIYTE